MQEGLIFQEIKEFARTNKFLDKSKIPKDGMSSLVEMLKESERISISFSEGNPLTLIETIAVTLFFLGSSDQEVAWILDISVNTLKSYTARIKEKLDSKRKMDAIVQAVRLGIVNVVH